MKTQTSLPPPVRSLIIDDEADICFLLGNILTRRHIENAHANNLAESRQILKRQDFDLIFLDNFLPDGKGIDFVPYIKQKFPEVSIIFITAYVDENMIKKLYINGTEIDSFLLKPLHSQSINEVLDTLLNARSNVQKTNIMKTFLITFNYDGEAHTATVTKSAIKDKIDYTIHLNSIKLIQLFGAQITLFKENGYFDVNTAKDEAYNIFVDLLANTLQKQDCPDYDS